MAGSGAGVAVVIGGSMSGLLSALMLRRAGWSVDIYERVESELSGRGAGIVAQQELIERLRGLGLATELQRRYDLILTGGDTDAFSDGMLGESKYPSIS